MTRGSTPGTRSCDGDRVIGRVYLGGKYWAHNGFCAEPQMGEHIHYGENVIVGVDPKLVPDAVLAEYRLIFGDSSKAAPLGLIDARW